MRNILFIFRGDLTLIIILSLMIISPQIIYADGKHFPEKAYKKAPNMPSQRAVIIYKNDNEKLIIESTINGEGEKFGWVIPLPTKPENFEIGSAGFIKTLSITTQPPIINDFSEVVIIVMIIAGIITICSFITIIFGVKKKLLITILISLVIIIILSPTQRGAKMMGSGLEYVPVSGVNVKDIQNIGSYELAVLEAKGADELNEWLSKNGFAGLNADDRGIIADYIQEEWCFVAAKLRREGSGYSRPHPLAMTFPSEKIIYPLRLTATVGNDIYFEIFVIAEAGVQCDRLTRELCDTYQFDSEAGYNHFGNDNNCYLAGFRGCEFRLNIGQEKAVDEMWDGCVLTRFSGTLQPGQMQKDMVFTKTLTSGYRKDYYSHKAAREMAMIAGLNIWWIALLITTIILTYERRKKEISTVKAFRFILIIAAISFLAGTINYAVLPKVSSANTISGLSHSIALDYLVEKKLGSAIKAIGDVNGHFEKMSIEDSCRMINEILAYQNFRNKYTQEKIVNEDSPGNYTISEGDSGKIIHIYINGGFAIDIAATSSKKYDDFNYTSEEDRDLMKRFLDDNETTSYIIGKIFQIYDEYPYYAINARLYKERPVRLVQPIVDDLRQLNYQEETRRTNADIGMLACITRIQPPVNTTEPKEITEFLEKVEAWYNSNNKTGNDTSVK